jgi:hypothetical protein
MTKIASGSISQRHGSATLLLLQTMNFTTLETRLILIRNKAYLRSGNLQVQYPIIDSFCRLEGPETLLHVRIQRPNLSTEIKRLPVPDIA